MNEYNKECQNLLKDMVGNNMKIMSPFKDNFGNNLSTFLIYCDFTASGKALESIEYFIKDEVMPTYANVHSTVGLCADKTAKYFENGKEILREYTNAYGNYSIIFHGQGSTGSIHKLIEIVSLKRYISFYKNLERAFKIKQTIENKYNISEFVDLCSDLLKEIENQFKELFVNINFCFKFKEKNNYITKCILCNQEVKTEGGYHKHIEENMHQNNKLDYEKNIIDDKALFTNEELSLYDFIQTVKQQYYNKNNYLLSLINDYQKFKPIIFYSIYEHNSNSLSWKEADCDIIVINPKKGEEFLLELEKQLDTYKERFIKIGSFTACSNITGLLLDIDQIAFLMHAYNGFAFFDYAAGSPYLQMVANGPLPDNYRNLLGFRKLSEYEKKCCFKDAIFFSPHKFIGGPGTPGVLITHDRIYRNQIKPSQPGGGTVHFVYKDKILYIQDVELKEESGTPNIVGSIRIGLTINIRQKFSHEFIIKKDEYYNKLFMDNLKNISNLYILHGKYLENKAHIPIYSIMISYGERFLHANFICALLNDLFGIQSRPGCSCAPSYGQLLLGFDKDKNSLKKLQTLISDGYDIFKPGYCRLNLPYFYPEYIIEYIINAIKFICKHGYKFLGLYEYNAKSGKFWFKNYNNRYYYLDKFDFETIKGVKLYKERHLEEEITKEGLDKIFNNAENFVNDLSFLKETFEENQDEIKPKIEDNYPDKYDDLRWFLLFKDVKNLLTVLYKKEIKGIEDNNYLEYLRNYKNQRLLRMEKWSILSQI